MIVCVRVDFSKKIDGPLGSRSRRGAQARSSPGSSSRQVQSPSPFGSAQARQPAMLVAACRARCVSSCAASGPSSLPAPPRPCGGRGPAVALAAISIPHFPQFPPQDSTVSCDMIGSDPLLGSYTSFFGGTERINDRLFNRF